MQTKTKLITVLASLCGVLVLGMVAMGIAWAAATQTIQSTINVTYTVSDAVVSVSANKYFGSDTPTAFTGGTSGTISFSATDASTTGTLSTTDTALTSTNDYVIYEYVFVNNGANSLTAALAIGSTTNLTTYVIAPTTTRKTTIYTGFDTSDYTAASSISATTIAPGATAYAYVAMKVTDNSANASFSGTFTWTIQAA